MLALNAAKVAVGFAAPALMLLFTGRHDSGEYAELDGPSWGSLHSYLELCGVALALNAVLFGHSVLYWRRWSDEPGTVLLFGVILLSLPSLFVPLFLYLVWLALWLWHRNASFALAVTLSASWAALAVVSGLWPFSLPLLCCPALIAVNVRQGHRWRGVAAVDDGSRLRLRRLA